MKIIKFVGLLLFLSKTYLAHAQQKVSLDQCMGYLMQNHPISQQKNLIEQNQNHQIKSIQTNHLPQLSVGGQATWQSDVTSVPFRLPDMNIPTPPQDQYRLTLDFSQNLWDGGFTHAQKNIVRATAKTETEKVSVDLYQVKIQLVGIFYGIILQEKLLINLDLLKNDLNERMRKTEELRRNGIASKNAELNLKSKILDVELQINDQTEKRKALIKALNILTHQNYDTNTPFEALDTDFEPLTFSNQRPEISWMDAQIGLMEANKTMIKSKNQPKLMLFGTGGYGQPGLNMLANSFDTYFIGGISLKIPLTYVYSGSQKFDFEAINVNKEKIKVQKEVFDQNLKIQYENQVSETNRLEKALLSDEEQIKIKNQIRELADAQYNNGIISMTELLSEITAENTSKQNKIIHEVQLQLSKYNLKSIKGTL